MGRRVFNLILIICLFFLLSPPLGEITFSVLAFDGTFKESSSFIEIIKGWLDKTSISQLSPELYSLFLASLTKNPPASSKIFVPQPMKDLSTFNLASGRFYIRPWETSGLVECEPWGIDKGKTLCLEPDFPGDLPCPLFMDCDGDGYFWWKGEDCDENCPTCYVGSPHTSTEPDGRDQDCDGLVDDDIECIPKFGASKPFGYDSSCTWTTNTNYTLINEGEVGETPKDEVYCQKRWEQCTDYRGGFGNCTVSKTPGYFVKGEGVSCGGGIWRTKLGDSIFDCGKALRSDSYKGYYGCGGPDQCTSVPEPLSACKGCDINASFDFPKDLNGDGIIGGPWGLCHGYSEISCQAMTGCERKIVSEKYH